MQINVGADVKNLCIKNYNILLSENTLFMQELKDSYAALFVYLPFTILSIWFFFVWKVYSISALITISGTFSLVIGLAAFIFVVKIFWVYLSLSSLRRWIAFFDLIINSTSDIDKIIHQLSQLHQFIRFLYKSNGWFRFFAMQDHTRFIWITSLLLYTIIDILALIIDSFEEQIKNQKLIIDQTIDNACQNNGNELYDNTATAIAALEQALLRLNYLMSWFNWLKHLCDKYI